MFLTVVTSYVFRGCCISNDIGWNVRVMDPENLGKCRVGLIGLGITGQYFNVLPPLWLTNTSIDKEHKGADDPLGACFETGAPTSCGETIDAGR